MALRNAVVIAISHRSFLPSPFFLLAAFHWRLCPLCCVAFSFPLLSVSCALSRSTLDPCLPPSHPLPLASASSDPLTLSGSLA
eukprot:1014294-Rhodomonas_salina.1